MKRFLIRIEAEFQNDFTSMTSNVVACAGDEAWIQALDGYRKMSSQVNLVSLGLRIGLNCCRCNIFILLAYVSRPNTIPLQTRGNVHSDVSFPYQSRF